MKGSLPHNFEVPHTTPQAERRRLVSKGKFLAEYCLADGHTDCVLGFVDHCLGKSPPQLDVVVTLWESLSEEYELGLAADETVDESRSIALQALLRDVATRLQGPLKSL